MTPSCTSTPTPGVRRGLDAFHKFSQNMPSGSDMAFVVLLHLPTGKKSMLLKILARWTSTGQAVASGLKVPDAG
jgi:hypothetical protein